LVQAQVGPLVYTTNSLKISEFFFL
jgi:hypothetical protein